MNVVYLTETPPWPVTNGGVQRSNLLHRALSSLGPVKMVLWNDVPLAEEYQAALRKNFGLVTVVSPQVAVKYDGVGHRAIRAIRAPKLKMKRDQALAKAVEDAYEPGDVVVARILSVALRGDVTRFSRCFLDVDDLEYTKYRSRGLRGWKSVPYTSVALWQGQWLKRNLPGALRCFRGKWVADPADMKFPGLEDAVWLPNIPFDDGNGEPTYSDERTDSGEKILLFVGYLGLQPNIHGLDHFLKSIWPRVRAQVPHSHFRIVGGGIRPKDATCWSRVEGVELVGFVEDLKAEYLRSTASVAPLYSGAGTNIKVLESLKMGTPVIASSFAHRGYEDLLRDGEALWVARDDPSMVSACVAALTDAVIGRRLAVHGRRVVEEHFNYTQFSKRVVEMIRHQSSDARSLPATSERAHLAIPTNDT